MFLDEEKINYFSNKYKQFIKKENLVMVNKELMNIFSNEDPRTIWFFNHIYNKLDIIIKEFFKIIKIFVDAGILEEKKIFVCREHSKLVYILSKKEKLPTE